VLSPKRQQAAARSDCAEIIETEAVRDGLAAALQEQRPLKDVVWLALPGDGREAERCMANPSGFSEDKKLEVASVAAIDVNTHLAALDRAWNKRRSPASNLKPRTFKKPVCCHALDLDVAGIAWYRVGCACR